MAELSTLSDEELSFELKQVEAELEDLEEVRFATLGQTGVHIGAGQLRALQRSWQRDESQLRERLEAIQNLLNSR